MIGTSAPRRTRIIALAVLLVGVALVGGVGLVVAGESGALATTTQGTQEPALGNETLSGEGYIDEQYDLVSDHPNTSFVWKTGGLNVTIEVTSGHSEGEFRLCGRTYNEEGERLNMEDCVTFEMDAQTRTNASINLSDWPDDVSGKQSIVLELSVIEDGEPEVVSESATDVYVLERDGDLTGDGLTNEEEVAHGTDFTIPDTAGNGLTDWQEVNQFGTDPLKKDTTGDGIDDATLVRFGLDPTEPYLAHKYGLVLLLFMATATAGVAIGARRLYASGTLLSGLLGADRGGANSVETTDGGQTQPAEIPDASILTNEEFISRMLEQHEGRMKQRQIVEGTDWSKAKVSRVLSKLEDQGQIRKIQVGRENVIELRELREE